MSNLAMNEYFPLGNNIDNSEEVSINDVLKTQRKINSGAYTQENLKNLTKCLTKARLKCWDNENLDFRKEYDREFIRLEISSKNNDEDLEMNKFYWQKELINVLEEIPGVEKLVFREGIVSWDVIVLVAEASTRLTFEIIKKYNSFLDGFDSEVLNISVISSKNYSREDNDIVLGGLDG